MPQDHTVLLFLFHKISNNNFFFFYLHFIVSHCLIVSNVFGCTSLILNWYSNIYFLSNSLYSATTCGLGWGLGADWDLLGIYMKRLSCKLYVNSCSRQHVKAMCGPFSMPCLLMNCFPYVSEGTELFSKLHLNTDKNYGIMWNVLSVSVLQFSTGWNSQQLEKIH